MLARSVLSTARGSLRQQARTPLSVAIKVPHTPRSAAASSSVRSLHSSTAYAQGNKKASSTAPTDSAAEGVDPGYQSTEQTKQQPGPAAESESKPSSINDPFPLPFDPRLDGLSLNSEHQSDGLVDGTQEPIPLRVPGREPGQESREVKLARLIYQTRKRGTLEADLLLSTFAKRELKALSDEEVDEFDRLLDEPDWDIFYWMTDRKPVVDRWKESFATEGRLGWRLRKHARNEEREQRFMPNL